MKWQFETWEGKNARLSAWHPYFCWTPVVITGTDRKAWLETIYRKGELQRCVYDCYWSWTFAEDVFEVLKAD